MVEELLRADWPFGVTLLKPGLFAFPYFFGLEAALHLGRLLLPAGEGQNAPPSEVDIARCAVATLLEPKRHRDQVYRPTGPELVGGHEIAARLGALLGRKVRYQDVSTRMFLKAIRSQGFTLFEMAQLRHYVQELRHGAFAVHAPNDHVERLTGSPPETLETTMQRYLEDPTRIRRGLRIGGRLSAWMNQARIVVTRPPGVGPDRLDRWSPFFYWAPERAPGNSILKPPAAAR